MISVITPVYNAERFLAKAIESVIHQKYVTEYILIDDGSLDKSWQIIKEYSYKYNKIVALQHKDKKNHGRSQTRNIGIKSATNKWIAFLDADDYYLENRFLNDIKIINKYPETDGVYNAIGIFFYDSYKGDKKIKHRLTTIRKQIPPQELFENMSPIGKQGWFSCDGFLVKKEALKRVGYFNEKLIVAEDTDLQVKLSLLYNLKYGYLNKPVAIRGVHDNNIFLNKNIYRKPRLEMLFGLIVFSIDNKVPEKRTLLLYSKYFQYLKLVSRLNGLNFYKNWKKCKMLSSRGIYKKKCYVAFLSYVSYFIDKLLKILYSKVITILR